MVLTVLRRSYALGEGIEPAAVVTVLRRRFRVDVGSTIGATGTVVDTADRRLRAAGLEAVIEGAGDDGGRLVVSRGSTGPRLSADVGGRRRWLVEDVPPGELRARLASVLEMRALLPLARLRTDTTAVQVLNQDEKTVVRLVVVRPTVLGNGERVTLAPRVEASGVLGYGRSFDQVNELLQDDLGLVPVDVTVGDEAVAAVGGDPAGMRTKVAVDIRSDQSAGSAAIAVLTDLAGIAEANLPGTIDDLDTEFLHDLRVAVRRSRSVLRQLKGVFPADVVAEQRPALKWIQTITGPTRDLDVQLLEWEGLVADLEPARGSELAPVRVLLERQRAVAFRAVRRRLMGARFASNWTAWRAVLGAGDPASAPGGGGPDAQRTVSDLAGSRVRKVYRRMVADGSAIDEISPPEALHELRKRGKELRYLLELFGGLWPVGVVGPLVKTLKALQDVLGTHQDRHVQAYALRSLAPQVAGVSGGPSALLALGAVVDRLGHQQHAARADFGQRFAGFAADDQRSLVADTFRGPA